MPITFGGKVAINTISASGNIWVTGPNTILLVAYNPGNTVPTGNPQTIASTTPISINLAVSVWIPNSQYCVPYEYSAAMAAQLPGCGLWVNLPYAGSDALFQAIAQKIIPNVGPNTTLYLEFSNENWNGSFPTHLFHASLNTLMGYLPTGTSVAGHYTTTGQAASNIYVAAAATPWTCSRRRRRPSASPRPGSSGYWGRSGTAPTSPSTTSRWRSNAASTSISRALRPT